MGSCTSRKDYSFEEQLPVENTFESNYMIEEKIGAGGFGTIFKARHVSGAALVVKMMELTKPSAEAAIMAQLDHSNIIQLFETYTLPQQQILILEYIPDSMDLFDYIENRRRIAEKNARHILQQLTSALCYLHEDLKIAHLDVKPENILIVSTTGQIKLIDFGASQYFTSDPLTSFKGTRQYASPEILFQKSYDPVAADVWAVGVTFFKMVMGRLPFKRSRDYLSPLVFRHTDLSDICLETLAIILNPDPFFRPNTIRDIRQCFWMKC